MINENTVIRNWQKDASKWSDEILHRLPMESSARHVLPQVEGVLENMAAVKIVVAIG